MTATRPELPWGPLKLGQSGWTRWRIGPATLWVERRPHEWGVAWCSGGEILDSSLEVAEASEPPAEGVETRRIAATDVPVLELMPRLPDRTVVIRPVSPMDVVNEAVLYVSTPIWLCLGVPGQPESVLEWPAWRPSDTWFGPSTREGVLAYASKTRARLSPEDLEVVPSRAMTRVHLVNRASTPLKVQRINLPSPSLSLYLGSGGQLWTSAVRVARDEHGELGDLELLPGAPPERPDATLIAPPRQPLRSGVLSRALNALIG